MTLDIKFYLSLFLRRLHYFLLVTIVIAAAGLTIATTLPASYQTSARLLIEGPQIPTELAASTVQTGAGEQIQAMRQRLTTRDALVDLADDLDIYPNRFGLSPDAIAADMRNRVIIQQRGNLLWVGFRGPEPVKTTEVANELVTRVLDMNAEMRRGTAVQTLEYFEQEVERLSEAMDAQSEKILNYKLANRESLPESLEYRRAQQTSLQERLTQLNRDRSGLEERKENLVDLYERTGRVTPVSQSPEQQRLQQLRSELESALLTFSPQNPRVRLLRTRVANLEAEIAADAESSTGNEGLSMFEIQMADLDEQIDTIDRQIDTVETRLVELEASIAETPQRAIELDDLQRDLSNLRSEYNAATSSLVAARTGERIESLSKGQRLTVLEPATRPNRPTSPDRMMIAMASVGGGIGAGLALVVLLELLNSSIRRPVEITNKLGISPIATLPYLRTAREQRRRRLIIGAAFLIALVGIPGTIWALHTYYLPLDLLIERVIDKVGLSDLLQQLRGGPGQ